METGRMTINEITNAIKLNKTSSTQEYMDNALRNG
jgi:hypothetical protein